MNGKLLTAHTRMAGMTALGGAVIMLGGAVLYFSSGLDLWAALANQDMASYLVAAGEFKGQLIANLSLWILGVLLLGMAISSMGTLGTQQSPWTQAARVCAQTAVPLALIAFIAMMSLLVQIVPEASATAVALAEVIGWISVRADDLATALLIGFAPLFIAFAGRNQWVPSWLVGWAYLAGGIGVLSLVALYIPVLSGLGFLIVPVGIGWMLAAGITLLRRSNAASESNKVNTLAPAKGKTT
jgi:hypothetical protein